VVREERAQADRSFRFGRLVNGVRGTAGTMAGVPSQRLARPRTTAHPRIDGDTVRVRFTGYEESSLRISIRVYAATREWNDFFAIREDILLRIYDIVTDAGSAFAFPSRTLYMARDDGLDADRGEVAKGTVKRWRSAGRLPFPRLPRDEIERLEGTLDYPPYGSPEASQEDLEAAAVTAEPLSSSPEPTNEPAEGETGLAKQPVT